MATAGLIVVGNGINGLVCAALPRRTVLLLERNNPIGGCMRAAIHPGRGLGDGAGDMLA